MNIYNKQLSKSYSDLRQNFTSPDSQTLGEFYKIGIKDKKVLDFGCGDGRYSIKFVEDGAEEVVGVDTSSAMIELAEKRHKEEKLPIKFIEIGDKIPFGDDYFDAIFSNFVIHYILDIFSTFKELNRVLKPNGHFVAILNAFKIKDGANIDKNTPVKITLGEGENSLELNILPKTEEEIIDNLKRAGFTYVTYDHVTNQDAKINPNYVNKDKITMDTILFNAVK